MELFRFRIPKPTSFPPQCFVSKTSVQNQFKAGNTKLNGIWKHAISIKWTELMENRWRTDGTRVENFAGFTTLEILTEIQAEL